MLFTVTKKDFIKHITSYYRFNYTFIYIILQRFCLLQLTIVHRFSLHDYALYCSITIPS